MEKSVKTIELLKREFTLFGDWMSKGGSETEALKLPKSKKFLVYWQGLNKRLETVNELLEKPRSEIEYEFGKANRHSFNFEEIEKLFHASLDGEKIHQGIECRTCGDAYEWEILNENLKSERSRLFDNLGSWEDQQLRTYLIPHPLLGKTTVLESLIWFSHELKYYQSHFSGGLANDTQTV